MEFKNIEKKYRPVPFWSWNTKLDTKETARQIGLMDEAGIGGYFMHARGGLTTKFMGEEWFENISTGITEGKKRGMEAWAYDENGWPSGVGDGMVNGLGVEYQQKYLRFDRNIQNSENVICYKNGYRFYYEINPYYVDTLNGKVTDKFIEKIYQPYYDRYKSEFSGFFTDEPQISRNGIPWSFILPEEYEKEYGENLTEHIDELFMDTDDYKNTRVKFWRLVTVLFSKNYMKKIYDWCTEHQLDFTGHMACEETLHSQLTSNGACMPHYEYLTMPGMDWLGRDIYDCFTPLQVASASHQLGKKQILSETFACCGHNVGMDELKAIYQWQMVHGITRLCQHLEGYSLAGLRKRDYPPAMYYQQPWWKEYRNFNDAMSRIGMILTEGEVKYDTLLMHNQSSAWKCYDDRENKDLEMYNQALLEDYRILNRKHILFHFGDEILMERHAYVEGNTLVIGAQKYKTIVIPKNNGFMEKTDRLLKEFRENGGIITTAEDIAENDICSSPMITYTERTFKDYKVYYFINNHPETVTADFRQGGKVMNIETGELRPFSGSYVFAPYDSLILIDDGSDFVKEDRQEQPKALNLEGEWQIVDYGQNILTLDTCDVYFDGVLTGEKENVADVLYMALDLKKRVQVRCDYYFNVADVPSECYLACETPEKFNLTVNRKVLDKTDRGYFVDPAFRRISLEGMLKKGKNTVSAEIDFCPDDKTYEDIEKAWRFETQKNKLTLDVEFEAMYLIGDFAVETSGVFEELPRDVERYHGDFLVKESNKTVKLSNIQQQGFPFFAGRMTLRKVFSLQEEHCVIKFDKKGINAVHVRVNGIDCGCVMWGHLTCDISHAVQKGENIVELTLVNNLRNMLGPHHLPYGETWGSCPRDFYKRGNVWIGRNDNAWNMEYCLAEVGLYWN